MKKKKYKYGNVVKMCKRNVNHKIFWIFINNLIETMGMSPYITYKMHGIPSSIFTVKCLWKTKSIDETCKLCYGCGFNVMLVEISCTI